MSARQLAPLVGRDKPRLAPPWPLHSHDDAFTGWAETMGITFIPWQSIVGRYLYAVDADNRWLYPEVCGVVARQNGKTELLVPHIVLRLAMGRRVMHTAQNRELPRHIFNRVAAHIAEDYPGAKIRHGAGQETIEMPDGQGLYRIVAPTSRGARGPSNDDLIVDEVRELATMEFAGAAMPTLTASSNPQALFLSNAGEDDSVALNGLKLRSSDDPSLAYLEWSASPDRSPDDRDGWAEANPSLGHFPRMLSYLENSYRSHKLAGTLAIFETEHLCRWVNTTRTKLVEEAAWMGCAGPLEAPTRPVLAFSMDPEGRRASAAIAWRRPDGTIGLRLTYDVTGNPIDTDRLGEDLRRDAARMGIRTVGFDPLTDAAIAKYFVKPQPISGGKFANATAQFCNLVEGKKLVWADAAPVTDDLTWTARKVDTESGSYEAVRVKDDRPITAALAAVRAVWLASVPKAPTAKVH